MFNVLQIPNDTYNGCRFGCSPGCDPSFGFSYPASSATGRRERLLRRRERAVHQELDQPDDLVGPGYAAGGEIISSDSY